MKNKRIITIFMTALLAICMCVPVLANDRDSADNVFAADKQVSLSSEEFFSAFAAGSIVSIDDSTANGSVFEAGQDVSISLTAVGESLYIAGNNVNVSSTKVVGNIFAAGNSVILDDGVESNAVYATGNDVSFAGETKALYIAGSEVTISGKVDGDAYIEGADVTITDDAVITGKLKIASANEPEVSDSAKTGDYDYEQIKEDENSVAGKPGIGAIFWGKIKSCLFWIVAMGAFGMLLVWLFNSHLENAAELLRTRPGVMIGSGVVTWFCVPIVALIMCISYILAPVAGLLMLAYVFFLCIGLAFAGASLIKLFLPKMNPFLSALIGIAALEIIRVIPVIGFLVGCVADMYLLAYVVQRIWKGRFKKEEVENV